MVTLLLVLTLGGVVREPPATGDATTTTAEVAATQPAGPSDGIVTGQGLPRRAPHPRTLHAFWPVFGVFALSWLGITGYMLSFGPRLRRVADGMRSGSRGTIE